MTVEQAVANLDRAVSQINANREVHNTLLQSLQVIAEALKLMDKEKK
jgi:truncated hemoglobin YjbI